MQAALFKVDFGANQNDADGVELTDWDVIGTWTFDEFNNGNAQWNLTDFAGGADRDVTLTIKDNDALNAETGANPASGMTGNNPTHENLDVVYDGVDVPYVVKDDYLYRVPDAAGTEMIFDIADLNPGRYSVTLFEGRTTDQNQEARLWVGDANGSNEPAGPNTGSFSGVGPDGPNPEGFPRTFTIDISEGDHLWLAYMEDNSGGISGLIIRSIIPVQSTQGLFKLDFGANQNDADSVELDDWDVIGTWTFDDFDDGNASWNLSDFGMGIDSDVTLTIFDNEALNAETGANPASGMTGNNPTHENLDVVYDGIDVPYVVKDDYLYRVPDAAGTEMFFKIANLNPGRYSVTIFEGRTTDQNQEARLWVGDDNRSNEPSGPNTGSYSGVGPDGPNPEGFPRTFTLDIGEGDNLWFAYMEDNSGGISGMIIRALAAPQSNQGTFKMDFGANQNDADGVELDDWDVIGTWTFDDFDDGNAVWNLSDFGLGIDKDVTLKIRDNDALNDETGANPATGMTGNNPTHENLDVVYDGIDVPYVVKDDYLYRSPDAAGTEMIFQISNLDPGRYSVTIFEGRTTDQNQVARLWVGDDNGSNEPAGPNTGSYSGVGPDGPNPEGFPRTFTLSISEGEHLWFAYMEDNSGGISGMIIRSIAQLYDTDGDGMPDAWEIEFGLNPDDASDAAEDCNGNGVSNFDEFKRSLDPCDSTPPAIIATEGSPGFDTITLSFSEGLDQATAEDPSNYSIEGLTITAAKYRTAGKTVTLTTSQQTDSTTYAITMNGVSDASGNVTNGQQMAYFNSYLMGTQGVLKFSYYGNLEGNSPYDLYDDARYPDNPDQVLPVYSFNSRDAFRDDARERYGAVIEGLITPTESGDYHFFLRSDDNSELYISTDDDPENLEFQAEETGCCGAFEEVGADETTFAPISMVAGKSYYIMAIYKEGVGGDFCQVAWRKEGDDTAPARLRPIPGEFLSSPVELPIRASSWQATVQVAGSSDALNEPTVVDFGELDGDASYEFYFKAVKSGASTAIAGNNSFAIKLDQWREQGKFGTTQFGVADNLFEPVAGGSVASVFDAPVHVVVVNDTGAGESRLYVNGSHAGTWGGNFVLPGDTKVMGARLEQATDHMGAGSVMYQWATYSGVLSANDIAAKHAALGGGGSGAISSIALDSGSVIIEYSGTLKSSSSVTGPYTPVAGASSPHSVTPNEAQAFFIAE